MHIDIVPNRNSASAVLLRESYREGGKVRKRTLANLSCLPGDMVQGLKVLLKGGTAIPPDQDALTVERSLPHGHVAAALGTLRATGLDRVLGPPRTARSAPHCLRQSRQDPSPTPPCSVTLPLYHNMSRWKHLTGASL